MQRGAASSNLDRVEALEIFLGEVLHFVKKYAAGFERDTAFDGFAHRARLLVNLLEHEMLEAAFFRLNRVPGDTLPFGFDLFAGEVSDAH